MLMLVLTLFLSNREIRRPKRSNLKMIPTKSMKVQTLEILGSDRKPQRFPQRTLWRILWTAKTFLGKKLTAIVDRRGRVSPIL
jgi:hypothetical protein